MTTKTTAVTTMILAAAFALTFTAQAQTSGNDEKKQHVKPEHVLESFKRSLKSDVPGIVEGTVYNIVIYKKYYPQLDYTDLIDVLNRYSLTSDDVAIRYKAHLASFYLTNDAAITIEPIVNPEEHDYIFRQIAEQLESKFLVTR